MRRIELVWMAAIPALFSAGAVLARAMLSHAPSRIAPDLAQPLVVVTSWGGFGAELWALLAAVVLAVCIPYALLVRSAATRAASSSRASAAVVAMACLAVAAAWCWPVIFSSDVYAYATYGDLAARGFDPYAHRVLPDLDSIVHASFFQWGNPLPVCVYGPLFVWIAAAIARLTQHDAGAALWLLRAFELLAFVGALVAYRAALRAWQHKDPQAALRAFALNPMVVWSVAEGHNDIAALAAALAAVALIITRSRLGGLTLAASVAIKATGIVAVLGVAPFMARGDRRTVRRFIAGAVVGLALVAAAAVPLWRAPPVSTQLPPATGTAVLPGNLAWLFAALLRPLGPNLAPGAGYALALGAGAVLLALAFRRFAAHDRRWIAVAAFGLLYAAPQYYPWYAVWLICAGAAVLDAPAGLALVATALAGLLHYLPDAVAPAWSLQLLAAGALVVVPTVALRMPVGRWCGRSRAMAG